MVNKIQNSGAVRSARSTPAQYHVLRDTRTERAFTGEYAHANGRGRQACGGCGSVVFRSDEKFDSGSGWPSFWAPAEHESVETESDRSYGMVRTEVKCSNCGGHLGHVFDDGPKPTGLRYCINSAALKLDKK